MAALSELREALESGSTLWWSIRHVPDGNAQSALDLAWWGENDHYELSEWVVQCYGDPGRKTTYTLERARRLARKKGNGCSCKQHSQWVDPPCKVCCDVIRKLVACPSWDALHLPRAA